MKVPGIKCENGHWNDLSVKKCRCGKPLTITSKSIALVDPDKLVPEQIGTFNQELPVHEQKCGRCFEINYKCFSGDPQKSGSIAERCTFCGKRELKSDGWKLYGQEEKVEKEEETPAEKPEEKKDEPESTAGSMRAHIIDIQNNAGGNQDGAAPQRVNTWGDALRRNAERQDSAQQNGNAEQQNAAQQTGQAPVLMLRAIVGGSQTFQLQPKENEAVVLGREAKLAGFLENDPGVGRYHCSLFFQNGKWHVVDFHSTNGTWLNDRQLPAGYPHSLNSDDKLRLGALQDSVTFRLLIES